MKITKIVDEHTEQVNYFNMLKKLQGKFPELILAHANPNGESRGDSIKSRVIRGAKLKAEGVKSGVPDIFVPIAKGGFNGLYIEMKKVKGWTLKENQKFWLNYLNDQGYCAIVCRGAISAFVATQNYLNDAKQPIERYAIDKSKFGKKSGLSKQYQRIAIEKGWCE